MVPLLWSLSNASWLHAHPLPWFISASPWSPWKLMSADALCSYLPGALSYLAHYKSYPLGVSQHLFQGFPCLSPLPRLGQWPSCVRERTLTTSFIFSSPVLSTAHALNKARQMRTRVNNQDWTFWPQVWSLGIIPLPPLIKRKQQ